MGSSSAGGAAVECRAPVSRTELDAAVDEAERAWAALDDAAFREDVDHLAALLLPCLADPLPPASAARVHLLLALQLFNAGDTGNAALSAAAARAADPALVPGPDLLPAAHPLRAVWAEDLPPTDTHRVPTPRVGSVAFDGVSTRQRAERPTIVQLFDETGVARQTAYLGVREPLPAYAAIPRNRNRWLGCAGGLAAGGAGAAVAAAGLRASLFAAADAVPALDADALDARRAAVNALSAGSWTLFAGATGCGVGALAAGPR